jgi:hypothetical protein
MKSFSLSVLALCLAALAAFSAPAETQVKYLSGTGPDDAVPWDFFCTGGRNSGTWTKIPVPSCWEQHGFGTYNYGVEHRPARNKPAPPPLADEQGKYRTEFTVPADWRGRAVRIVFEAAMTDTEVWINGTSAGPVHQGGFYRFHYDITPLVKFGAANRLEVTVSKKSANESVNRAERIGDYWTFGGIYRPVWLEARPLQHIEWTAIDARADGAFLAEVHLAGKLDSPLRVVGQVENLDGTPVGQSFSADVKAGETTVLLRAKLVGIKTWTAETPSLYRVRFVLSPLGGDISSGGHAASERFGFRTFEVRKEDGLYLNGVKIRLKGVNRHSFRPESGRTLSRAQCYDDVRLMKEMNMNAVRMSHYPPDVHFLEACDELGLYVLDELAGWQGAYDTPTGARLIGQIVRRDVNHPSILFWDNGNEGGWNTEVDGEFAKWDPQRRPVLHPWGKMSEIDTDHYEVWDSHVKLCKGPMIYMPTEFLHGLYDGGHGAGLRDYWNEIMKSPTAAGGFLWSFADEGVARADQGGRIDCRGNLAPDGIVGPHHEREGSFYTIKEIWSPVQLAIPAELPATWDGTVPVSNHFDFTDLRSCRFEWQLLAFPKPAETKAAAVAASGTLPPPVVAPHRAESLRLPLPANWRAADALALRVCAPSGDEIWTWTRPIARDAPVPVSAGQTSAAPAMLGQPEIIALRRQDRKYEPVTLTRPPVFRWSTLPDGAVRLDYEYSLDSAVDIAGVRFAVSEGSFKSKRWLGFGPYRVWQNRVDGLNFGVHQVGFNDPVPGETFTYPEFKGYFRDWRWLVLETAAGRITVENTSGVPFYGLGKPKDGVNGLVDLPDVGLAFLDVIPAQRNKFHSQDQLGPQSQPQKVSGVRKGTLTFRFDAP